MARRAECEVRRPCHFGLNLHIEPDLVQYAFLCSLAGDRSYKRPLQQVMLKVVFPFLQATMADDGTPGGVPSQFLLSSRLAGNPLFIFIQAINQGREASEKA